MVINTLIGTETVRMERLHLVQKLYSFLDIPKRSAFYLYMNAVASEQRRERAPQPSYAGDAYGY